MQCVFIVNSVSVCVSDTACTYSDYSGPRGDDDDDDDDDDDTNELF